MKVIAMNSSARKDGNTAIAINTIFEELNKEGIETEMIQLANTIINPCIACWACSHRGNCINKKDQFHEIFEKLKTADGIILASPVYSANISANMQAFLERAAVVTDMNRDTNDFKYKVGAAICAARRSGAVNTVDAMNHFFLNHEMFVVGSTYWNMVYGQMPGDVQNDEEGLANMKNIGQNMAYLLNILGGYKNEKI
ncbi:flavodoxin family protein [Candidatus Stoquefichus sp. SB1]|uniref:flavodoxin family protein n=1 Tax=Candidatus Stoquefichus sp. SB1 TaxID=1658109 RepID=UPI00067F2FD7|nr:flavodoxin family protein [Candidatus Stoquefichus sp. SB1]